MVYLQRSYSMIYFSEDVRDLGFTVVIDMRGNSSWTTVKPILKVLQDYFSSSIHTAHIIKPDNFWQKQRTNLGSQKYKFEVSVPIYFHENCNIHVSHFRGCRYHCNTILVYICMRISWRTIIRKNIPRAWRPWPTGEMVYCECGTSRYPPTFALGVPHSCVCIGSMIAVYVYSIYTSDERLKIIATYLYFPNKL